MRKTLREIMQENRAAEEMYAKLNDRPLRPMSGTMPAAPVKRVSKPRTEDSIPLEKEVQKAIITFLLAHPRVALVVRHNAGAMDARDNNGKAYPIFFHKVYKHGLRIVDLDVTLKSGKRFVIECKRPGWRLKPHDARDQEQAAYISFHKALGNLGCFACSIDDVQLELERG
jgi:hypothetical protein